MKKTMKKLTCTVLAAMSVFGCAATMSACETSHPEVKMEIAFNGNTYTLEYKLYRKIAPQTVAHFLWLAENDYYNGLAVHDYDASSSRMYTGSYSTNVNSGVAELVYKKYFDEIQGYADIDAFPHSVWVNEDKTSPTYTLKGEFENENHFEVTNGALQETFGSLTMHYEHISNETEAEGRVYFLNASDNGTSKRKYQQNHATSAFFISMTSNPKSNSEYCTFATLAEKSEDVLKSLQSAISDYISENYDSEDEFTQSVSVELFEDHALLETTKTVEYDVPVEPIVINKVEVKKY